MTLRHRRLLLLLLAPACGAPPAAPEPGHVVEGSTLTLTREGLPVRFETAEATLGARLAPPAVTGRVTTLEDRTAPVSSPLEGRVVQARVRLGDRVRAGERLVKVATPELPDLERQRAQASLFVKSRQAVVERLTRLLEARAAAASELAVAETELLEAKLALRAASSRLSSLAVVREGDNAFWVTAPRDGVVVQIDASPGREVGPGRSAALVTVAELSELLVIADVRPSEAPAITVGLTAEVSPLGSRDRVPARVESVSDVLDPDRQMVPVRLRLEKPGPALRPNAYVTVTFLPAAGQEVVQVPAESVVTDGADSVVFVALGEGRFQKRAVETGRRARDRIEIVSGLERGQRVVSRNALLLLNALDIEG